MAESGAEPVANAAAVVGSSHAGEDQLRGQAYMRMQAERTLESPLLTICGGPPLRWYCLNDIVMGGMSSSQLELTHDGTLQFSGCISTRGGGFAGCRTEEQEHVVPSSVKGVWLTISGKHSHSVKFTMGAGCEVDENDPTGESIGLEDLDAEISKGSSKGKGKGGTMVERWAAMTLEERRGLLRRISWQCPCSEHLPALGSEDSGPRRFFLPLASFTASLYGQPIRKLRSPVLTRLTHIGLSVGVFDAESKARLDQYTDGPFAITLHSIEFE
eukprot:TRINITY_DN24771_c0_g1_i1.p1 TRINITY_DN24771_c0_g1~~TRINITY_DN24771_c0_g1_i1.p1  ORF type:complete len:272 (+),score=21.46 TRINITY_DN24771_c0_g1_i1:43-858(+)